MKDISGWMIEELPWQEILEKVHHHYYENLEKYFVDNPELLELFRNTQIGLQYNPETIECATSEPIEQANTIVWDELSDEVTENLHGILIKEYQVPAEQARAVKVSCIGAIFMSPPAPWGSSCPQWHKCGPGCWVTAPCPCSS